MEPAVSRRTTRIVGGALVAGSLLASALAWPDLPREMAIHWDATGSVDRTASRTVGALVVPLLAAGMLGLAELLPKLDPLGENVAAFRGYYNGVFLLVVALLAGVQATILAANLGYDVPIEPLAFAATGGLLGYVGLVLQHAEPNWFVGVRTPWTLSSDEVWRRTNDLAGRLFVGAGAGVAVAAALGWVLDAAALATALVLAIVLVAAFVPVAYSYWLYASLEGEDRSPELS